jgi:glucan biosynthesis protein C
MSSIPRPPAHAAPAAGDAPATDTAPGPGAGARLHHLDALRGGALLLGVLLHALMPYLPWGGWLVQDGSRSPLVALVVGVVHLFRMVLFMMLAGYFGRMVLRRRGAGAYLRDRLLRIGLPLVVLWPVLFGLLIAAIVLAEVVHGSGVATGAPPPSPQATGTVLDLPTMHLWFLLLLLEIVLVVLAVRAVLVRLLGAERAGRWAERIGLLLSAPGGMLLAALPYALALLVQGDTIAGIVEPYTLVPVLGASIGYAGAFLVGWFLHAAPDGLTRAERHWAVHLVLALVLTGPALLIAMPLPLSAAAHALAGWAWVHGLLGLCGRVLRRERPVVRYLADASYWVYLWHFPLLLIVAVPLASTDWPILLEVGVALAAVMAVLLLSYDVLVRGTWLGRWLNGHRRESVLRARLARR